MHGPRPISTGSSGATPAKDGNANAMRLYSAHGTSSSGLNEARRQRCHNCHTRVEIVRRRPARREHVHENGRTVHQHSMRLRAGVAVPDACSLLARYFDMPLTDDQPSVVGMPVASSATRSAR